MLKKTPNRLLCQVAPLALLTLSIMGCTVQPSAPWLSPEPQAVSYRTEMAIARLTEILHRAELSEEQSAQLYYDRGVMFDSVGLRTLARLDFMRALRLKPDMADAYNFVGIHHTVGGEFSAAYEAFDSVLELEPDHEFAYLNRGIALYYDGKIELAEADFSHFLSLKPNDAYRVIWLYLAQSRVSKQNAVSQLKQNKQQLDPNEWSTNIVAFFAGDMSEQALLSSVVVDVSNQKLLSERLCEVYFYLAKWHESELRHEQALEYYKKVLATNVFEFVEHRYARLEISRLTGVSLSSEYDDIP